MRSDRTDSRDRLRIAELAARLLREGSAGAPSQARRKAAARLGIRSEAALPSQAEIETALRQQQALFAGPGHASALSIKREAALQALAFLQPFEPRLVGPVLDGTASAHTPVTVHLHTDEPEAVPRFLHEQRIPANLATRRLRLQHGRGTPLPCWLLDADGVPFELLVLPRSALRQPPLHALDDRPMARASLAQLRQHIAAEAVDG